MQQLAPQVGLNPSQGALLPKSGERGPRTGSGLWETPDSDCEGQAPRLTPQMWAAAPGAALAGPGQRRAGRCPGW